MLRLGHRQPVAGHDDDVLGVGQLDGGVVDADLADRAAGRGRIGLRAFTTAEAADHDVQQRAVHGVSHELGEDAAGRTDEGTGDDEQRGFEHEAGHRGGRAGERVEQADDDRHVRAADGQHHGHAEGQRSAQQHQQQDRLDLAGEVEDRVDSPAPSTSSTVTARATTPSASVV